MGFFKFRVAFATDDGENLIDRHFGDANFYEIYDFTEDGFTHLKRIENTTKDSIEREDEKHGDPEKAKKIIDLLRKEGVDFLVSRRFGPNITRVIEAFTPVVVREKKIEDVLRKFEENEVMEKLLMVKRENKRILHL